MAENVPELPYDRDLQKVIEEMWEASGQVLADTVMPNGSMIAANNRRLDYPPHAEGYSYVWMRDNAYNLVATSVQSPEAAADRARNYQHWLWERAEGFSEPAAGLPYPAGVVLKRYHVHGALDRRYGSDYQPDQAGAMLWALDAVQTGAGYNDALAQKTMRQLANGLAAEWEGGHFRTRTQDLWENTSTASEQGDSFTYSLAACIHGLHKAIATWENKQPNETSRWVETADTMGRVLANVSEQDHYLKKIHPSTPAEGIAGNTLDASLLGLVYPFANTVPPQNGSTARTVAAIGDQLLRSEGIVRYEGDTYSGIAAHENGAGSWPLLTFWYAIARARLGDQARARNVYQRHIAHLMHLYDSGALPSRYMIPEQIFPEGDARQGAGVLPLGWSHAMFVLATRELGLH